MSAASCQHCGQPHSLGTRYCPTTGGLIGGSLLPAGTILEGKYRIESLIGTGGMGAVFRATHVMLGHHVAVKVLLPEASRDEQMSARLVREGRAASATGHPNIAAVTDMGQTDEGALFVVMEFIDGKTLEDFAGKQPMGVELATLLICQVLSGLEAVHRSSIVHRDLKPANIMVTLPEGEHPHIKILDFGISKTLTSRTGELALTQAGLVFGTPHYMAPEQSKGAATVDHRADLYSVAAIYYKLLTGVPPFDADTLPELMALLIDGQVVPPSQRRPEIPRELDAVVLRGLARQPGDRFGDARSFRSALMPFVGRESSAAEVAQPGPLRRSDSLDSVSEAELVLLDGMSADRAAVPRAQPFGGPLRAPDTDHGRYAKGRNGSRAVGGSDSAQLLGIAPVATGPQLMAAGGFPADSSGLHGVGTGPFAPPAEEQESLELAIPIRDARSTLTEPRAAVAIEAPTASSGRVIPSTARRSTVRRGGPLLIIAGLVLVLLGGGVVWFVFSGQEQKLQRGPDEVAVTIETEPPKANVYIDGVLQVSRTVSLPRSEQTFKVRIDANGYHPRLLSIVPRKDLDLRISLRPRR
ncbi:MAG: protein kinase [Deltaproteobacteria bacterium]|nr:protein kinase [Deltaproteobacteria bacterium]